MKRLLCLALLLLAAWCPGEAVTVTVLYTSDVHGHLLPTDEVRQRRARGSLAQVATLVARLRAENPRTLVLDGGDTLQGTPLTHYVLADRSPHVEDPTVAAMNAIGYDAAVVGNHEFNYGLEPLRRAVHQSHFPWLAANLTGASSVGLPIAPVALFQRGGVRLAVVGLTNPNVPHWDLPEQWAGLGFADPVAELARRLPELRRRADVVIVVAHTGFERDLDTASENGSSDENFAWRLAQVAGVDLLLTGHTHQDIPPRRLAATVVAQPGRWAEVVTRVDLDLEPTGTGWRVVGWRGANLPTASEAADAAVVAAVEPARVRVATEFSRVIGTLAAPLAAGGVPTRDDAALDLVHAAQLDATGAQLSLAAPLSAGRVDFPAGPITPRLAHALYPYPNSLVVVRVSGAQLRDILEHAAAGWQRVECAAGPPCTLERSRQRPAYTFDTLEGADYALDPSAPPGQRVLSLRIAGRPIGAAEQFTLVINSYRAAGGGSVPHLATAPRLARVDRPMPDILVDYLSKRGTVVPIANGNWVFTLPFLEVVSTPRTGAR
ncbi:MAG: bifunctional metallophosphatase/5'-nucleotidase [Thermoanaerobaculaceae bacterium]|nr:bifunctional metallophosphatase/5'-nucleotidase [Thermoanaerobaculaceae bacterium]